MQRVVDFLEDILRNGGILTLEQINTAMSLKIDLERGNADYVSLGIRQENLKDALRNTQREEQAEPRLRVAGCAG
jgi:uncharacterized protein YpuA (DUF1002 family)